MMIQKPFFKHLLTLLTGTAVAQMIPVLFSPLLTRLYSPSEFGVLCVIRFDILCSCHYFYIPL